MSTDKISPQLPNYFELFQNILNPFTANAANAGEGMASNAAAMMMKSLDPKEIARKKQELETVLMWLKAQVGVVELSIKTLEYQLSLAEQFANATQSAAANTDKENATNNSAPSLEEFTKLAGDMNPAAWAMKLMQHAGETKVPPTSKAKVATKPASKTKPKPSRKR